MAVTKAASKDMLAVSGGYDLDHLDYHFINPDRVFRATHFFIDQWLPLLGPSLAWLVVAMQQACWRNGTRHPTGQISQRQLGKLCDLKRETVNRHLNNPNSLLDYFITATDPVRKPDGGRGSNRYHIVLNDPLPPLFIAGLQAMLIDQRARQAGPLSPETSAQQAIKALLDVVRQNLITTCQAQTALTAPPAGPATVRSLVADIFDLHQPHQLEAIRPLATRLSRHILRPDQIYISSQYFREKWVPLLGATQAWLITVLRRHCYQNKARNELRDTFTFDKKTIAAKLGISTKTLRREFTKLEKARPFFPELKLTHHTLHGRVLVNDEPLTPEDAAKKQQAERALTPTKPDEDSTHRRQLSLFPMQTGQKITGGIESSRQKVTGGGGQNRTKDHRGSPLNGQKITGVANQSRHKITGGTPVNGQLITDSKHTDSKHQTKQHQADVVGNNLNTQHLEILDHLEIRPPTRDELLALAHIHAPGYLETWLEWYRQQDEFGPGWVVQQLRAGVTPPKPKQPNVPTASLPQALPKPAPSAQEQRWQETLALLQLQMTKNTFDTWLKGTSVVSWTDQLLTIEVKTPQAQQWLDHRLKAVVERAVAQVWGRLLTVCFEVAG